MSVMFFVGMDFSFDWKPLECVFLCVAISINMKVLIICLLLL